MPPIDSTGLLLGKETDCCVGVVVADAGQLEMSGAKTVERCKRQRWAGIPFCWIAEMLNQTR